MSGLNTDVVVHCLPLQPGCGPIKQKLRRMKPEWNLRIKEEVVKQLEAGFLEVTNYLEWLANIVPAPKKDRKVRMYVDYKDLNKASPKDDFPLPHIDSSSTALVGIPCSLLWMVSLVVNRSAWL